MPARMLLCTTRHSLLSSELDIRRVVQKKAPPTAKIPTLPFYFLWPLLRDPSLADWHGPVNQIGGWGTGQMYRWRAHLLQTVITTYRHWAWAAKDAAQSDSDEDTAEAERDCARWKPLALHAAFPASGREAVCRYQCLGRTRDDEEVSSGCTRNRAPGTRPHLSAASPNSEQRPLIPPRRPRLATRYHVVGASLRQGFFSFRFLATIARCNWLVADSLTRAPDRSRSQNGRVVFQAPRNNHCSFASGQSGGWNIDFAIVARVWVTCWGKLTINAADQPGRAAANCYGHPPLVLLSEGPKCGSVRSHSHTSYVFLLHTSKASFLLRPHLLIRWPNQLTALLVAEARDMCGRHDGRWSGYPFDLLSPWPSLNQTGDWFSRSMAFHPELLYFNKVIHFTRALDWGPRQFGLGMVHGVVYFNILRHRTKIEARSQARSQANCGMLVSVAMSLLKLCVAMLWICSKSLITAPWRVLCITGRPVPALMRCWEDGNGKGSPMVIGVGGFRSPNIHSDNGQALGDATTNDHSGSSFETCCQRQTPARYHTTITHTRWRLHEMCTEISGDVQSDTLPWAEIMNLSIEAAMENISHEW
ncbi:hypothetical protein ACRALDRAFT_2020951 [Sodiomyces alcalophilus JCM 7366]|uniref:uncharacterized protein n=1 Tax=Sodiomyces alcalophilus JCM 7366 TaxID=591952 RepID=UPI0039B6DA0F